MLGCDFKKNLIFKQNPQDLIVLTFPNENNSFVKERKNFVLQKDSGVFLADNLEVYYINRLAGQSEICSFLKQQRNPGTLEDLLLKQLRAVHLLLPIAAFLLWA